MHRLSRFIMFVSLSILLTGLGQGLFGQSLYQKFTHQLPSDYSSADVISAILAKKPYLNRPEVGLNMSSYRQSPGGIHYTFIQTYDNIEIYQAQLTATLNHSGKFLSLMDATQDLTAMHAPSPFVISSEEVGRYLPASWGIVDIQAEACYDIHNQQLLPAFLVQRSLAIPPFEEEFLISGIDGQILDKQINLAKLHPATSADSNGRGHIFNPDPVTVSDVDYGVLFTDNNDADDPDFYPLLDTVVLRDLTYRDGKFHLEGPYVEITDLASFFEEPVTSSDGNFFFTREESGFEEVMAYYHIDTFQRYVQSLGFLNLFNEPIKADAHGFGNQDQSGFIYSSNRRELKFGDGGIDDAEDAEIIIHEYAHALSFAGSPFSRSGQQRQGLDEGISDYFAASYSARITNVRNDRLFKWDGNNLPFWNGRPTFTNEMLDPQGVYNIYEYGTFWCSTISRIRQSIGQEVTDRLQLQELYSNVDNMSLADAAMQFLDADSLLYGGAHTFTIISEFCRSGILQQVPQCNAVSLPPIEAPSIDIRLYPQPASDYLILAFSQGTSQLQDRVVIQNQLGQTTLIRPISSGQEQIRIELPFAPGIYQLRYLRKGQSMFRKTILIVK